MRGGVLQRDVADAWVRRSRLPHMVGLDLRAKIAANKNAAEQVLRLIDKYGADTVKSVMRRMMDDAERRLRAKLETLPEGTWSAVGYQEQSGSGDRGLHAIKVAMTKQGDKLVFDFRGTAGQTGIINCPYPGLRAGIVFTMLPLLAGDIPWAAGGLMRCFEILTDEDTITNASFPAAVGLLGRTLGVGVAADKNGSQEVLLAELDEFKYRLALHPAAEDVPREIGWIVDSPGELDRLTRRLEEAGYRREGSPEEAELRGATRLRWFTDPVGYRVELAVGQAKVRSAPARPNDGGRGITGLGHLVLAGPPLAELRELYETVLEFRLTDYRAPGLYFYRCNRTHHSIALARADTPSIHHLELEHESLDDVGRSYDRALANDVPISISLGRHTNDKAISFYVENPSGFQLEIGCGGIEIGDDWVPHDFGTSDVWGHHHIAPNPFAAS